MTTEQPPPIIEHDGGVLIRGQALQLTYKAFFLCDCVDIAMASPPSPLLVEALRVVYRACKELQRSDLRHRSDRSPPPDPSCEGQNGDLIGAGEAAFLLGVSRRQVLRIAVNPRGGLDGVRIGRTWAFDRAAVLALKATRDGKASR